MFQEVRGRIFLPDGQALGPDFVIASISATAEHGLSAIAPLAGGGFVVTWQSATGGSDNASFSCYKAPAYGTGALGWDYGSTTWHTDRDSYDKVVEADLKHNATLVAMLAFLASEDPTFQAHQVIDPLPAGANGQPGVWRECTKAQRQVPAATR